MLDRIKMVMALARLEVVENVTAALAISLPLHIGAGGGKIASMFAFQKRHEGLRPRRPLPDRSGPSHAKCGPQSHEKEMSMPHREAMISRSPVPDHHIRLLHLEALHIQDQ